MPTWVAPLNLGRPICEANIGVEVGPGVEVASTAGAEGLGSGTAVTIVMVEAMGGAVEVPQLLRARVHKASRKGMQSFKTFLTGSLKSEVGDHRPSSQPPMRMTSPTVTRESALSASGMRGRSD
jgi:hypothetical protein